MKNSQPPHFFKSAKQARIALLVIGLLALIIWLGSFHRFDRVASYDWGYECGYITASLRVTERMETVCGKDKKYEYWGSERWREGYRDGERMGKIRARNRTNTLYCNQLDCW